MNNHHLFEQLLSKKELSTQQMREVIQACMTGQLNDIQIATFLALMRMKGETTQELSTAALVMKEMAHQVDLGPDLIDIVGTGGDGKNTFNVSTASSFVVAASGIAVAKHGNRSVSSSSGSADLLEQAGFVLKLTDAELKTCINQCNLAFLFAPHFHPAMQHVRSARQQLGIRTFFNLLGPLVNPAHVKKQVVGVYSKNRLQDLASVLVKLGSKRALVVSSEDGLDEISIAAPTQVLEWHQGEFTPWTIHPEHYGLKHNTLDHIIVQSPKQSLQLIQSVLAGEKNAAYDMVVINAGAAIYCAREGISFEEAVEEARHSIDSGKAQTCFENLKLLTQTFSEELDND